MSRFFVKFLEIKFRMVNNCGIIYISYQDLIAIHCSNNNLKIKSTQDKIREWLSIEDFLFFFDFNHFILIIYFLLTM